MDEIAFFKSLKAIFVVDAKNILSSFTSDQPYRHSAKTQDVFSFMFRILSYL